MDGVIGGTAATEAPTIQPGSCSSSITSVVKWLCSSMAQVKLFHPRHSTGTSLRHRPSLGGTCSQQAGVDLCSLKQRLHLDHNEDYRPSRPLLTQTAVTSGPQ
ncbi:hypothetical protein RRG08_019851 [Elysia crispata]|uniref:Uncharacterized protein n=1 Tax=Elysia crispata TaxID=231223 RepID=A0AAE0ZW88_9GAST|nr:hypothetical protein RRG08_019851 [Elysia crispata]